MKRAFLYARVSTVTKTQNPLNKGQNPAMQLEEIREYCERRGFDVAGEFVDAGISGAKERRPQLDAMLTACRKRKADAVIVYRFDRFARSTRHLVNALAEFEALGIDFISLHENIDTSTPTGKLAFSIFAAVGEFEREIIRARVRSGLQSAKAHGIRLGRRPVSVSAHQVKRLRASGASLRKIAAELSISLGTASKLASA